jgi:PAS domain-containing protein
MAADRNMTQGDPHWLINQQSPVEPNELSDGVIVVDKVGSVIFANPKAVAMHGRLALGTEPTEYSQMHGLFTEDGRPYPSTDLPLARAALFGETVHGARWRIRRPDGSTITAVGDARPIFQKNGEQTGAVLVFRETT